MGALIGDGLALFRVEPDESDQEMAPCFYASYASYILLLKCIAL